MLNDVSFSYPSRADQPVLDNVTLHVRMCTVIWFVALFFSTSVGTQTCIHATSVGLERSWLSLDRLVLVKAQWCP